MTDDRPLVVGIGNAWRRDDAVGLVAARRLRAQLGDRVVVSECSGDLSSLLHLWQHRPLVVLVDAMDGGVPGAVHRLAPHGDGTRLALPTSLHSTHALGVADAIALGEAIGMHPARLVLYAVGGAAWGMGDGLSPEVEGALPALCARIIDELAAVAPAAVPPGGRA